MCCSGPGVRVLSLSSGECIHTLRGHKNAVSGIKLNPHNPYQVSLICQHKSFVVCFNINQASISGDMCNSDWGSLLHFYITIY